MIQNVNNLVFGNVTKVGQTPDGRCIYSINGADGKSSGKISVAHRDCDVFEKSYNKMMNAVPKLQEYSEKAVSPDFQKHKKKQAKRARWIGVAIGAAVPIVLTRKMKSGWIQALITLPGAIAGFFGGSFAAVQILTPPGAKQFTKSAEIINKLDIRPYDENENLSAK
ncbi:hypothetical protein IJD34_03075 [bacterium]|nr:hypothetical protein [bacterium]